MNGSRIFLLISVVSIAVVSSFVSPDLKPRFEYLALSKPPNTKAQNGELQSTHIQIKIQIQIPDRRGKRHATELFQQPRYQDGNKLRTRKGEKKNTSFSSVSQKPSTSDGSPYWLPPVATRRSEKESNELREAVQTLAIDYLAQLIQLSLNQKQNADSPSDKTIDRLPTFMKVVEGKFFDMTYLVKDGETKLQSLFVARPCDLIELGELPCEEVVVVKAAILALQSLLILGMQFGAKETPAQRRRTAAFLETSSDDDSHGDCQQDNALRFWSSDIDDAQGIGSIHQSVNIPEIKRMRDIRGGLALLLKIGRKCNAKGAFNLLLALGIWSKHEDLALLRSGHPLHFTPGEKQDALDISLLQQDPEKDVDAKLGLRQDLTGLKVYTIDDASTVEIDDGISVEILDDGDSDRPARKRYWVHIADADHWAPVHSGAYIAARKRGTSLYLPTGSIPMLPDVLSSDCMSLKAMCDKKAISLGVEVLDDGSLDVDSIVVTASTIRVDFRLSYIEADEMLEEGVGFCEEWELGDMLSLAKKRRRYRVNNGAIEGLVSQMPKYFVTATAQTDSDKAFNIKFDVESSDGYDSVPLKTDINYDDHESPSKLLITEIMIMAGEAMGKFGIAASKKDPTQSCALKLPYRSQTEPDFRSRPEEYRILQKLISERVGGGFCASWYVRRFLQPVKMTDQPLPHKAMGLDCYVQWTSPIRRFNDLQVHATIKRFLRYERMRDAADECTVEGTSSDATYSQIDFSYGMALARAAQAMSRASSQYWLYEYIRQWTAEEGQKSVVFTCTVLGLSDPGRQQYSIFVHDLALEHKYISEKGELNIGEVLYLSVLSVDARMTSLLLTLANNQ